jgi:transposase
MTLSRQDVSAHQIARQLGIARATVAKLLRALAVPDLATPARPRKIDPYLPSLRERWTAGEHNARTLWKEIHGQGSPCSAIAVRRIISSWRSSAPQPGVRGIPLPAKEEVIDYSTRRTRWLLCKPMHDLSEREAYVTALKQLSPPIAQAQRLLATFRTLLSARHEERLAPFVAQCEQSGISELVGFARGLRPDFAAVQAALRYDWSQGPIEGQINRLKLLKRQLYGRAKFDLLRQRVLFQLAS